MMGVAAKRALGLYRSCAPRQVLFTKSFLEKAVSPLGHDDSDLVSADTR